MANPHIARLCYSTAPLQAVMEIGDTLGSALEGHGGAPRPGVAERTRASQGAGEPSPQGATLLAVTQEDIESGWLARSATAEARPIFLGDVEEDVVASWGGLRRSLKP